MSPAKQKSEMTTRAQQRARQARLDAKARKACVEAVWKRADSRCEKCGRRVEHFREAQFVMDIGHVHEVKPRSLGGNPHDPDGAKLLCLRCHQRAHRLRVAK